MAPPPSRSRSRTLIADVAAPSLVRTWLEAFLGEHAWPVEQTEVIVFLASEAVSNAVEHAYPPGRPGPVEVRVEIREQGGTTTVRLVVADQGHWRPVPIDPGHRGRGLSLMRQMAASMHLAPGPTGTVLTMTSHLLRADDRDPAPGTTDNTPAQALGTPQAPGCSHGIDGNTDKG
ncbi:MAG: ATP-binding protein [Sporichthyaceae bacterium]